MSPKRLELDRDHIVEQYLSGTGIKPLADALGISPRPVERVLREAGVALRGASGAMRLRWERADDTARHRMLDRAHSSTRGKTLPDEQVCKVAAARERRPWNISPVERELAKLLGERGVEITPQLAIGRYNVDLAARPVAVEVFGGGWHFHGDHLARFERRTRKILDSGWSLLMLVVDGRRWPFTSAHADYAAAYVEEVRRDPTLIGEYRVVWGAGEFVTRGRAEDNKLRLDPPFGNARNPTNGRYERVAA